MSKTKLIIDRLIDKNQNLGIYQMASNLKNKAEEFSDTQMKLLEQIMNVMRGDIKEGERNHE